MDKIYNLPKQQPAGIAIIYGEYLQIANSQDVPGAYRVIRCEAKKLFGFIMPTYGLSPYPIIRAARMALLADPSSTLADAPVIKYAVNHSYDPHHPNKDPMYYSYLQLDPCHKYACAAHITALWYAIIKQYPAIGHRRHVICRICNNIFWRRRSDKKFCSIACKQAKYRQVQGGGARG